MTDTAGGDRQQQTLQSHEGTQTVTLNMYGSKSKQCTWLKSSGAPESKLQVINTLQLLGNTDSVQLLCNVSHDK
jgi:hypothetical protein